MKNNQIWGYVLIFMVILAAGTVFLYPTRELVENLLYAIVIPLCTARILIDLENKFKIIFGDEGYTELKRKLKRDKSEQLEERVEREKDTVCRINQPHKDFGNRSYN